MKAASARRPCRRETNETFACRSGFCTRANLTLLFPHMWCEAFFAPRFHTAKSSGVASLGRYSTRPARRSKASSSAGRLKDCSHKPVGVKTATFSRKASPEQGEQPASKSHVQTLQRPHCRHDATLPAARHHPATTIRGNQKERVQDRASPMTALPCLGPDGHRVKTIRSCVN